MRIWICYKNGKPENTGLSPDSPVDHDTAIAMINARPHIQGTLTFYGDENEINED